MLHRRSRALLGVRLLCLPLILSLVSCAPHPLPANENPEGIEKELAENQRTRERDIADSIATERHAMRAHYFGVTEEQLSEAQALIPATQEEKVASLMMVGVRNFDDALFALHQGAGGIFVGSWTDPGLLTDPGRDLAALRAIVGRPFSVSIDAEGGRVQRQPALLGSVPAPRTLAESTSPEQTQQIAFELGVKLRQHGVTVDFAPVLDTDSRPANDAIGDRSFSGDPETVRVYATAFARGLADAGIRPVYKHFPGHGRASGDSHLQTVTSPPLAEVLTYDLAPYGPTLTDVPGAVMMGHVSVPGLGDASPSSLNSAAYTLLRTGAYPGGAAFPGVIYTDDLSGMKAISAQLPTPMAVAAALRAGADCALWISTAELPAAIAVTDQEISAGRYSAEQVEDSVTRLKLQLVTSEKLE